MLRIEEMPVKTKEMRQKKKKIVKHQRCIIGINRGLKSMEKEYLG